MHPLRVALFPCAYNEIDGVAHTMHQFEAYAKRHHLPLLNVHGGYGSYRREDGSLEQWEFRRSWPRFRLDERHDFDLNFWRYLRQIEGAVREFSPDLLHITGPSDVGQIGALVARRLRIPLVASWHTNVHEYAQKRLLPLLGFLPPSFREGLGAQVRDASFRLTARFYRIARALFAPNPELISDLELLTGKPCYHMSRGVDTDLFHPTKRTRPDNDGQFVIGYVGRLTTEKNIRFLIELESELLARGYRNFRFVIVGQGADESYLQTHLRQAEFKGVLRGDRLAAAYADFDVFAFPSRTDTFGNVVLEALASGVPAVVTDEGGPKYIVQDGASGFVAHSNEEFVKRIAALLEGRDLCLQMSRASRQQALLYSWDAVFRQVYEVYAVTLSPSRVVNGLIAKLAEA
jgi:phosphatidylinositol alpha 1,6-mannosyltransferase